jgi:lysozyme
MMIKGLDISYWNGLQVNYEGVKSDGYDFLYIKASEGAGRKEPYAIQQDAGAIEAGLAVGYYHFAHLGADSAIDEANLFYSVLQDGTWSLIPVLDVETNASNLAPDQFTKWLEDFVTQMDSLGVHKIMLYGGKFFFNQFLKPSSVLANCPLWLADYETEAHLPNGWTNYTVWQNTEKGTLAGVVGTFDVDVCEELPLA